MNGLEYLVVGLIVLAVIGAVLWRSVAGNSQNPLSTLLDIRRERATKKLYDEVESQRKAREGDK